MADTPPERFKPLESWTPDEHLEHRRTGQQPENPDYTERRRQVLADAGLEPADPDEPKPLEDLSPAEHDRRKYGTKP
jgi:hypothetical protein